MKSLSTGTALLLLLTSSPVSAMDNGDFTANSGNGELGFNATATGWMLSSWPDSYAFLWNAAPGTTSGTSADNGGAQGFFTNAATNPVQLWGPGTGSSNGLTLSPNGGAFIGATPGFHNGPIWQTLTGLTPGVPVSVSFDYAGAQQFGFSGPTEEGWAVSLGADTQDTPMVSISSHGFSRWQTASFTFTPISSSEVLSFLATGTKANPDPQAFALLDGVKVDPIPELSTWAMMALGFAGLGYVGFRSNRRKVARSA